MAASSTVTLTKPHRHSLRYSRYSSRSTQEARATQQGKLGGDGAEQPEQQEEDDAGSVKLKQENGGGDGGADCWQLQGRVDLCSTATEERKVI